MPNILKRASFGLYATTVDRKKVPMKKKAPKTAEELHNKVERKVQIRVRSLTEDQETHRGR